MHHQQLANIRSIPLTLAICKHKSKDILLGQRIGAFAFLRAGWHYWYMISVGELQANCSEKLKDAEALVTAKRYDSALYLCGFAVELALKARVCRTLNWTEFPLAANEFKGRGSLRTHKLEYLLPFTGLEADLKKQYMNEWSSVGDAWNPEMRYEPTGQQDRPQAERMLKHAKKLVDYLCKA